MIETVIAYDILIFQDSCHDSWNTRKIIIFYFLCIAADVCHDIVPVECGSEINRDNKKLGDSMNCINNPRLGILVDNVYVFLE